LEKLEELGLIRNRQKQRLDATHIFGHLRKLSLLECMAESMRLALKRLADLLEDADFERLVPVEIRELYTDELTTQHMDEKTVRRSLRSSGGHALTLLERVAGHSKSSELLLLEQVKTLRRVFEQYFEVTPEGASVIRAKTPKGEGKDRVVTPHEVEARWSEKRGKEWVGYKLQVTETADRPTIGADGTVQPAVNFITDIAVTNAAEADAQVDSPFIELNRPIYSKGHRPSKETGLRSGRISCGPVVYKRGSYRRGGTQSGAFDGPGGSPQSRGHRDASGAFFDRRCQGRSHLSTGGKERLLEKGSKGCYTGSMFCQGLQRVSCQGAVHQEQAWQNTDVGARI